MKRVLSFLVVLAMFGSNVSVAANVEDTGDIYYDTPYEKTYDITPDIQIFEPGTIRVLISWATPTLTFAQRARPNDNARYYALKADSNVIFNVVNNSRASSTENGFNGNITIIAKTVEEDIAQRDNIVVNLARTGDLIPINNGETFNMYKLSYANRADEYINGYPLSNIITAGKTADEIRDIMTVKVQFTIAARK